MTPSPTPKAPRLAKLPLVLLACLTIVSFGGPFLLGWVLSGGEERAWPPDRPVEWLVLVTIAFFGLSLFVATLAVNFAHLRSLRNEADAAKARAQDRP